MSDLPNTRMAVTSAASLLGNEQKARVRQFGAKAFFDGFRTLFGIAELDTAAKNPRRYRSAVGGTQVYSDQEIEEHPLITEAEDSNRTRFLAQTVTAQSGNNYNNDRLLNLRDGGEFRFVDHYKASGKLDSFISKLRNPNTFAAFGPFDVRSTSDLVARRKGNRLYVTGTVRHGFDEETEQERKDRLAKGDPREREENMYNFNKGAIGSGAAADLEPIGAAKPFRMQYDRVQDLETELEYAPGGGLLLRSAKWGAIR
jgi:hypothetical protein